MDAWIDPPPYTGMAPAIWRAATDSPPGPAGGAESARAWRAHTPGLRPAAIRRRAFNGENGEYAGHRAHRHDAHVRVRVAAMSSATGASM